MIPIIPRESTEDDRPLGLKFSRSKNFFNFPKRETNEPIKRMPSTSSTHSRESITSISSPTIPTRSPFRIRDSQLNNNNSNNNKMEEQPMSSISSSSSSSITTIEDDLVHELENIWKLKSNKEVTKDINDTIDINSDDILLQLLISNAIIEAREYKILSFEEYEALKQHEIRLKSKIKNSELKLDIDRKIQETSYSLSNLSINKNRESVLLLLDETSQVDQKVKILTQRINELKNEQIETKYQILKHIAGVLCLGLQKLETEYQLNLNNSQIQSDLNYIKQNLTSILNKFDLKLNPSSLSIHQLLDQLETILTTVQKPIQQSPTLSNHEIELEQNEIHKLQDIISKMEYESNQIQVQVKRFQENENQLKQEIQEYKTEVSELRNEKEKLERTLKHDMLELQSPGEIEAKYEQQLDEQEQEYQAQLKEQAAFLDKTASQYEKLKQEYDNLTNTCKDLELLIKDKQKTLDNREQQVHQLERQLQQQNMSSDNEALQKLQDVFSEKENAWIEQSAAMEANFEGILREFDRLTGSALEFETDKQNYESRIEQLTLEVKQLEANLHAERSKNLNQANDTPTTASLRKEFRKMITDMKADHQRTLEREIEEKKRLEKQVKDLKHEKEVSRYERVNKGVQTLFIP